MVALFFCAFVSVLFASLSLATSADPAVALNAASQVTFVNSDWIWTPTANPNALIGLRKGFTPPAGKSLIAAEILVSVENTLALYVNGEFIGSGTEDGDWVIANRFCVDLLPSFNVFAVNGSVTNGGRGGLLAAILLTYSDGTTDTLVTDSSWRLHNGLPAGWEQPSFDDTTWAVATSEGPYQNFAAVFSPQYPSANTLDRANWIWTTSGNTPAGTTRAFRHTFTPDPNQFPMSASILIAADDEYTLWVNGVVVGTGTTWNIAQDYTVNFSPGTTDIVFVVQATNVRGTTAGMIMSAEISMLPTGRASCTAGSYVKSNAVTWRSTTGAIPAGFEQRNFDDSAWPLVVGKELYGGKVYGTISVAGPSPPVTI
ncbi:hypothetical protein DFH08DRAFT_770090 [Mycena albidolilacea]|uniref:Lectin n=1 Tax=Mycena albidolilacea TaxID=1033008 RepID=A0AAD7AGE5_9AGAR|nr:hypothetical protein DFH08DRAFT_770090 [Mycena albidolilacea]